MSKKIEIVFSENQYHEGDIITITDKRFEPPHVIRGKVIAVNGYEITLERLSDADPESSGEDESGGGA